MRDLDLAVIGAGPVGLALALQAARALPTARITVYDARGTDSDVAADPRTLALSLGSVHLLERLRAFDVARAQPILEVRVSQAPLAWGALAFDPQLHIKASEEGVPMLGAVLSYGAIVAPLQAAWTALCEREPQRLASSFGTRVAALKNVDDKVEIDAGVATRHDLAVVAEGGVFGEQSRAEVVRDYGQTAWVGQVTASAGAAGVAYERFTRDGPIALLPLPRGEGEQRFGLVWCARSGGDPVARMPDAERLALLAGLFPDCRLSTLTPLKAFALGLNASRTLTAGRSVRIGNAAQTLHPVAGQGLNLGLRDAYELVRALGAEANVERSLRRFEWRRASDRWSMIATTDFLARSFTWRLAGAQAARALALSALQAFAPARSALAREMMYGRR